MRVTVLHEVIHPYEWPGGYRLCLHWARYVLDDGEELLGYRFIWRGPKERMHDKKKGPLLPTRGQARIPSLKVMRELAIMAERSGWGHFDADDEPIIWDEPDGEHSSTVPGEVVRRGKIDPLGMSEIFPDDEEDGEKP